METYVIASGWRAVRWLNRRSGLDELALERLDALDGWREVFRREIPPKMPEEELVSTAVMYARLYDTARERGIEFAKQAFLAALDSLDRAEGEVV